MTIKIEDIVVHLRWGVCTVKNIARKAGTNSELAEYFICQLDVHRPCGINLDAVWVPASELYKIID